MRRQVFGKGKKGSAKCEKNEGDEGEPEPQNCEKNGSDVCEPERQNCKGDVGEPERQNCEKKRDDVGEPEHQNCETKGDFSELEHQNCKTEGDINELERQNCEIECEGHTNFDEDVNKARLCTSESPSVQLCGDVTSPQPADPSRVSLTSKTKCACEEQTRNSVTHLSAQALSLVACQRRCAL